MLVVKQKLKDLIGAYPSHRSFCALVKCNESVLSSVLAGDREVPKKLIERIVLALGIPFDDLFEILPDKNRRSRDRAVR